MNNLLRTSRLYFSLMKNQEEATEAMERLTMAYIKGYLTDTEHETMLNAFCEFIIRTGGRKNV